MLSIRLAGGAGHAAAVLRERAGVQARHLAGRGGEPDRAPRSIEGPSSPVPGDLLRLSVGIEAPGDLIADLEAALDAAARHGPAPAGGQPGGRPVTDLAAQVTAALERSVLPSVIARGGAVRVAAAVEDGIVTLEVTGSPGAVLPLASRIEAQFRAAVPEITAVRLVAPGAGAVAGAGWRASPSRPAASWMPRSTRRSPPTAAT